MRKLVSWLAVELMLVALIVGLWHVWHSSQPVEDVSGGSSVAIGLVLEESDRGVYVLAVSAKSAAQHAGLRPGDVILAADEAPLEAPEKLDQLLCGAETAVPLTVMRGEQVLELALPCR